MAPENLSPLLEIKSGADRRAEALLGGGTRTPKSCPDGPKDIFLEVKVYRPADPFGRE
jgi:hypothetical protein